MRFYVVHEYLFVGLSCYFCRKQVSKRERNLSLDTTLYRIDESLVSELLLPESMRDFKQRLHLMLISQTIFYPLLWY